MKKVELKNTKPTRNLKTAIALCIIGLIIGCCIGWFIKYPTQSIDVEEYKRKIAKLEDEIKELQTDLDRKEDTIRKLKAKLREKEDTIDELEGTIDELRDTIDELKDQLKEKDREIARLKDEIERLESKIDLLEKLVPKYVKGEWNVIAVFRGASDKITPLFSVPSSELRIRWKIISKKPLGGLSVWLYNEEGAYIAAWLQLQEEPSGEAYAHHLEPGYYYLKIDTIWVKYEITVEVWIPKE